MTVVTVKAVVVVILCQFIVVMDLGLGSASSRDGAQKLAGGKRRKGQVPDTPDLLPVVTQLCKLSLKHSQEIGRLTAAVMCTCMIAAASTFVQVGADTMKDFKKAATGYAGAAEDRDKLLGIPSVHIWNAWLKHARTIVKDIPDKLLILDQYLSPFQGMTEEDVRSVMAQHVPSLYIMQPFNQKLRKIEIFTAGPAKTVWDSLLLPLLRQENGFKLMMGCAPRGALVRQIQNFVDSVKNEDEE